MPSEKIEEKADWIVFAHGNKVPFSQDMGFFRGVPGGIYFEPDPHGRFDSDNVWLRAPGFGMLNQPNVEGHSLYGSGGICVQRKDLEAALKRGDAEHYGKFDALSASPEKPEAG